VPIFLERFILPAFAATVIIVALTNPMGLDKIQRTTGAIAIIFAAYFVAHTVYRATHPEKPPRPRVENGRKLAEWQRVKLIAILSRFPGSRILVLASQGDETLDYANDFRDIFESAKWKVEGPNPAPLSEPAIDVQVSADNYVPPRQETLSVLSALKFVGIKSRDNYILDQNVERGLIVIWIGAKSPDGDSPNNYPPLAFHKGF
jgi:hypothetical protein